MSGQAKKASCGHCAARGKQAFPIPFSMAFQPIYDTAAGAIFAHEALLRGVDGGGADAILDQVTVENRYSFDQAAACAPSSSRPAWA